MDDDSNNRTLQLTQEDRFLIELLVDGELEEPFRRDLLIRLDHISGGWRFCAITFLESQCFRGVLRPKTSEFCNGLADGILSSFLKNDVSDVPPQTFASRRSNEANGRRIADFKSGSIGETIRETSDVDFLSSSDLDDRQSNDFDRRPSGDAIRQSTARPFSASDGTGALAAAFEIGTATQNDGLLENNGSIQSARKIDNAQNRADDPLIIPLQKGGYSRGWNALTGRLGGGGSGGGPTWRNIFVAMSGGFFFALLLTGFIALLVLNHPERTSIVPNSSGNGIIAKTPSVPQTDDENDKSPIQVVKLKSSNPNLNGLEVPCYESNEKYCSDQNRSLQSNEYIEELRKNGHQVEAVYEDLMFPLEDGRVIIVPVETFNVQYQTRQNFQ